MRVFTDHDVLAALRAESGVSLKPVERFYMSVRPDIIKHVIANGGSKAEALRVLEHGMITLHRFVRAGKFKSDTSLSHYLTNICKRYWWSLLKKRGQVIEPDHVPIAPESVGKHAGALYAAVRRFFNQMEPGCRRILTASVHDQKRMTEIMEDRGIPDEQLLLGKRYRCLKNLKTMIEEDPQIKRQLLNAWNEMQ